MPLNIDLENSNEAAFPNQTERTLTQVWLGLEWVDLQPHKVAEHSCEVSSSLDMWKKLFEETVNDRQLKNNGQKMNTKVNLYL